MATRRSPASSLRRGRPPKFGRPSRLVALTLPVDVLARLQRISGDIARAVVSLVENGTGVDSSTSQPDVELAHLTKRDALIVVNRHLVGTLPGISLLPLDEHRAFLALGVGKGLSDLEVAVQDRLDEEHLPNEERRALESIKQQLRSWRLGSEHEFVTRAIIVVRPPKRARTPRRKTA